MGAKATENEANAVSYRMLRWILRLAALAFATKLINSMFGSRATRARRV